MPASTATPLDAKLRKLIVQIFTKKYSLQLHASSLAFIAQTLDNHDLLHAVTSIEEQEAQKEAIEVLAKGCLDLGVLEEGNGGGSSSMVTASQLQHVYQQLVAQGPAATSSDGFDAGVSHLGDSILDEDEAPPPQRFFDIIDAFEMPRVEWDPVAKTFAK